MIRTLIVDDHPAIRHGLIAILRTEPGIVPIGAVSTAAAALELAAAQAPRCVVVDLELGHDDGLELIRQLRALPEPPAVILYSAFSDASVSEAAASAGADLTIAKGAPVDEVIAAIKYVGRRRPRAAAGGRAANERG